MSAPAKRLLVAEFTPKVQSYWLLSGSIICLFTVIGIPFLLLWVPLGRYFTGKYLARMRCVLTERHLEFSKGIFVRTEKTIPLGKITDLGMVQGPIMRHFGIHALSIETAGQSGAGALLTLTGIQDAVAFRQAVLKQRDRLEHMEEPAASKEPSVESAPDPSTQQLLTEIRDTLQRIEAKLPPSSAN